MAMFPFQRNSFGPEAWLIELVDNPGCFFHLVRRNKKGLNIFTIRQGVQGAFVWKTKEGAARAMMDFKRTFPNTKLTALRDVVESNDGSEN